MTVPVSGTEGYAEEAEALVERYESLSFAENHKLVLHLIPTAACRVLDIGARTGRDAAGFAALGHRVVAVEPTAEMRTRAMALHPSPRIEWLDDSLPELVPLHGTLTGRGSDSPALPFHAAPNRPQSVFGLGSRPSGSCHSRQPVTVEVGVTAAVGLKNPLRACQIVAQLSGSIGRADS